MGILGQISLDQVTILSVDLDPTSTGVSARIGSIAVLDNGTLGSMWIKTAAGDTGWTPILRLATGTISLAANTLAYTDANGFLKTDTTKFTWDQTNGRLGIGLAAPTVAQSTIHIDRGNATGGHIRFTAGTTTGQTAGDGLEVGIDDTGVAEFRQYENSAMNFLVNNTRYLQLNPAGNLLIGSGVAAVDITGASVVPAFQIIGTSPFATQMAAITFSNDANPSVFNLLKSRGALNAQGLLSNNDELGRLQFRGSDGVNFQAGASVRSAVDGTPAAGSMPGRLLFMTTPAASTTPVERMRIDATGLVDIADIIRWNRSVPEITSQATANTTTTLTSTSNSIQIFTGTTTGQIVRLPDATTLLVGAYYEIRNDSSVQLTVQNNAGGALDTTPYTNGTTVAILTANGTVAGTWLIRTRFEPFSQEVNSTAGMSINSTTDVLITTMTVTPAAGIYRVTFTSNVSIGNNTSTCGFAIYAGGTINSNSQQDYVASAANARVSAVVSGTVTVDGTQAIEIRGKRSAGTTTVNTRTLHIQKVG